MDATYLADYKIKTTFDNGEEKIADCLKWLNGQIFEPLKDKNYFQRFFIDGWSIAWPNGADIATETLYEGMFRYSVFTFKIQLKMTIQKSANLKEYLAQLYPLSSNPLMFKTL